MYHIRIEHVERKHNDKEYDIPTFKLKEAIAHVLLRSLPDIDSDKHVELRGSRGIYTLSLDSVLYATLHVIYVKR